MFRRGPLFTERAALAHELSLVTHLLLWEHQALPLDKQVSGLRALKAVDQVSLAHEGMVTLHMTHGESYELDLKGRLLRQEGSPTTLDVSLAMWGDYRVVFEALQGRRDQAMLIGALTYAVYSGYHYGTPPHLFLQHVSDVLSHCSSQAELLHRILTVNGFQGQFVLLHAPQEDGSAATHLVVQAALPDGTPLMLDPSGGYLYELDVRRLRDNEIPPPIILPQCRQLDSLDLRRMCRRGCEVSVYSKDDADLLFGVPTSSP